MPKWEKRRLRTWTEGLLAGDITEDDLRWARSFLMTIQLRAGEGHVLGIAGEYVANLGMLAITFDRAGVPLGAFWADEAPAALLAISQSNPRRLEDVEDGD